mmetsp:Transcript_35198/g.113962  ORF Transcript_35198/g.113962 Transcript_35198/m.113962 type:complete len:298 (-) Transcript_35198:916-1809(-)
MRCSWPARFEGVRKRQARMRHVTVGSSTALGLRLACSLPRLGPSLCLQLLDCEWPLVILVIIVLVVGVVLHCARQLVHLQICSAASRTRSCNFEIIAPLVDRIVNLEEFLGPGFDRSHELQHVTLRNGFASATRQVVWAATDAPEDRLDARASVLQGLLRLDVLGLIGFRLAVDVVPLLFQHLQDLHLLHILFALSSAAERDKLLPVVRSLLLQLFDVCRELVVVVEESEVGVFVRDELQDERLEIRDASGGLDSRECLLVAGHLLLTARDGCQRSLCAVPGMACVPLLRFLLVGRI